jgi:hypothetical protein
VVDQVVPQHGKIMPRLPASGSVPQPASAAVGDRMQIGLLCALRLAPAELGDERLRFQLASGFNANLAGHAAPRELIASGRMGQNVAKSAGTLLRPSMRAAGRAGRQAP